MEACHSHENSDSALGLSMNGTHVHHVRSNELYSSNGSLLDNLVTEDQQRCPDY